MDRMDSMTESGTVAGCAKYAPVGRVVMRRIGEDRLLVPVSGKRERPNRIFPVNETGALIWESLAAGKSVGEAAAKLAAVFRVDAADALRDCAGYACELETEELLERTGTES